MYFIAESPVDDSIHQDLDGVAVCQEVDDVKSVFDNADLQINLLRVENQDSKFRVIAEHSKDLNFQRSNDI